MTQEEKAKAYDEALVKAKKYMDDGYTVLMPDLFPQLRESEDEIIRNDIMVAVENWFPYERVEEIRAYLEKQKEASKAMEAVDRIDKYIDEHVANAHDMKDSNPDKKYYRGWDDALGKMAGILQDIYSGEKKKESLRDFIDNFPYSDEQKEQKPVENPINWTELTWKDIIELEVIINKVNYEFRNGIGQEPFGKAVLERFREYKGDEYLDEIEQEPDWNDEDKKTLASIIDYLDRSDLVGYDEFIKFEEFLKSLRPSWKPSEHQMTILKAVKNYVGVGSGYWGEALGSLIEDLEKLM